jgi:SapB morphogen precursor RamS
MAVLDLQALEPPVLSSSRKSSHSRKSHCGGGGSRFSLLLC